jgi:hypothetical protein
MHRAWLHVRDQQPLSNTPLLLDMSMLDRQHEVHPASGSKMPKLMNLNSGSLPAQLLFVAASSKQPAIAPQWVRCQHGQSLHRPL